VGSTQEIHDRERKLILRLAKAYLHHLRAEEGAVFMWVMRAGTARSAPLRSR
jgi:hypothetical protein